MVVKIRIIAGTIGRAIRKRQAKLSGDESITVNPSRYPNRMPIVMNNWLSVPAGPPIDPGRHDVKYTGITIVLSPTARPNSNRENI